MIQTGGSQVFRKKPVSVTLCSPKIPLGLTGDRTKATVENLDLIVHVYFLSLL
jgi:hypothetical protein